MGQDSGEESAFEHKTLLVPWLLSLLSSQNKNKPTGLYLGLKSLCDLVENFLLIL